MPLSFPPPVAGSFRNRIINGNFDVWQRGASFSIANSSYTWVADRWYISNVASGVTAAITKVSAPPGFRGVNAINISANGVVAGSYFIIYHKFESQMVADFDGTDCTLSFDLHAETSSGALSGVIELVHNASLDNSSFATNLSHTGFSIPVGAGKVIVPLSASQMAGAKLGMRIGIFLGQAGSSGNLNATFGAVQLERGTVANAFEFRPLGIEMALCSRYYQTSYDLGVAPGSALAATGYSRIVDAMTSYASLQCLFKAPMRVTPSISLFSNVTGASGKIRQVVAAADVAAGAIGISTTGFTAYVNSVSTLATEQIFCAWTADAEL